MGLYTLYTFCQLLCFCLHNHRSGIIEAVAKDFFESEVMMTVINQSEEDERTGKKEHVVFHMVQKETVTKRKAQPRHKGDNEQTQVRERSVLTDRRTLQSIRDCPVFL